MFKDESFHLGRLARRITGLQNYTRMHVKTHGLLKADPQGARWGLVQDWAADCWNQLGRVMQGFYPKRLVRRLRRTLRYVDGVIRRALDIPVPAQETYIKPELQPGSHVVRRSAEAGIFAQLMALPKEDGYLLN